MPKRLSNFLNPLTVSVGITTIGILMGAFGGVTIANALEKPIQKIDFLAPYAETVSLTCIVILVKMVSITPIWFEWLGWFCTLGVVGYTAEKTNVLGLQIIYGISCIVYGFYTC